MKPMAFSMILIALIAGCVNKPRDPLTEMHVVLNQGIVGKLHVPSEFNHATNSTVIQGLNIELKAEIWRDVVLVGASEVQHVINTVLKLRTANGGGLPDGILVDQVWLVMGVGVWRPTVADMIPTRNCHLIVLKAESGPPWPVNAKVDVLLRIRESAGPLHYLKATGRRIEKIQ
jgi:hypothetical protein